MIGCFGWIWTRFYRDKRDSINLSLGIGLPSPVSVVQGQSPTVLTLSLYNLKKELKITAVVQCHLVSIDMYSLLKMYHSRRIEVSTLALF